VRLQQDTLVAFPASGEQRSLSSRDRGTPTFPSTLRDPAFDSGEARIAAVACVLPFSRLVDALRAEWVLASGGHRNA